MPTRREITQDIIDLATKFGETSENRLDHRYWGYKVNEVREDFICRKYDEDLIIDLNWFQPLGIRTFERINMTDDRSIESCDCYMNKLELPQIISLGNGAQGQQDLGLRVTSSCGNYKYFQTDFDTWNSIPEEHPRKKFKYYWRMGRSFFTNNAVNGLQLKFSGILSDPLEGLINDSYAKMTVLDGVDYIVGGIGSIMYNSVVYNTGDTFTGVIGVTTYIGPGLIFLKNPYRTVTENDPYPVSKRMARAIVLDIITKEYQLTEQQQNEIENDGTDIQKTQ